MSEVCTMERHPRLAFFKNIRLSLSSIIKIIHFHFCVKHKMKIIDKSRITYLKSHFMV